LSELINDNNNFHSYTSAPNALVAERFTTLNFELILQSGNALQHISDSLRSFFDHLILSSGNTLQ